MNATLRNTIEAAELPPILIDHDAGADAALLSRLRAGDEQAFAELVEANGARMLASARRLVGNEEEARDVVQEAFVLAFRSLSRFEARSRLSTWLHRITINVALMKIRRGKRRPELKIEDVLPSFSDGGTRVPQAHDEVEIDPESALHRERMRVVVRRCIDRLPAAYRTILLLRDIEDLSTEEAAEVLSIRAGAVKVRLHRARQALKTLIQKELAGAAAH